MKRFASLSAACTIVAILFSALPATATTVSECQGDIATLLAQTDGTAFTGTNGNKASQCQSKCEANLFQASKKLDQARFADAIDQMAEYKNAVAFCSSKGFVSDVDAAALEAGADVVIACIQLIGQ
jgi:hypothetical protein